MANDITLGNGEIIVFNGGVANDTSVNGGYLYVLSDGVTNSTTVNRMGCLHVSNGGAFDGTTFTLFIDDGAGVELTLNQTISGGEFDGYTLNTMMVSSPSANSPRRSN